MTGKVRNSGEPAPAETPQPKQQMADDGSQDRGSSFADIHTEGEDLPGPDTIGE